MSILLTRDTFRESVFARDGNKCVVCQKPAQDAHHIMERRLFDDGGYYIENGASLCGGCHIKAEQTLISPQELRNQIGIARVILPSHLYPDYEYDKWGNIVNANGSRIKGELFFDESVHKVLGDGGVLKLFIPYIKYPRTFHLPFSTGRTNDDRAIKDCSQFEAKDIIVMTKLDGENTTGYWDGHIHARSLDSDNHESRNWVKNFLSSRLYDLPEGWRINGENLYAKHSIHYKNLPSYFFMFAIWNEKNECLSWQDTEDWANLLGIPVPEVWYGGQWNEAKVMQSGRDIDIAQRMGYKDGFHNDMEGFVVRITDKFAYRDFKKSVAKFVRKNHIQTNKHWIRQSIVKNELCPST